MEPKDTSTMTYQEIPEDPQEEDSPEEDFREEDPQEEDSLEEDFREEDPQEEDSPEEEDH